MKAPKPGRDEPTSDAIEVSADSAGLDASVPSEDVARSNDPNKAGIRVDLSGIGAK